MEHLRAKTLLSDPVNARAAWHDAKKHATLLRLLVANLERGAADALADIKNVLETHNVLLDALSILSRFDNGALVWSPVESDMKESWQTAQKRLTHALEHRAVRAEGWEGFVSVDPALFLFLLTGALHLMAGACKSAAISVTLEHRDHLYLRVSARDIELPQVPSHLLDAAWRGDVSDAAWHPHRVTLAALQAVADRVRGHVDLRRDASELAIMISI